MQLHAAHDFAWCGGDRSLCFMCGGSRVTCGSLFSALTDCVVDTAFWKHVIAIIHTANFQLTTRRGIFITPISTIAFSVTKPSLRNTKVVWPTFKFFGLQSKNITNTSTAGSDAFHGAMHSRHQSRSAWFAGCFKSRLALARPMILGDKRENKWEGVCGKYAEKCQFKWR